MTHYQDIISDTLNSTMPCLMMCPTLEQCARSGLSLSRACLASKFGRLSFAHAMEASCHWRASLLPKCITESFGCTRSTTYSNHETSFSRWPLSVPPRCKNSSHSSLSRPMSLTFYSHFHTATYQCCTGVVVVVFVMTLRCYL